MTSETTNGHSSRFSRIGRGHTFRREVSRIWACMRHSLVFLSVRKIAPRPYLEYCATPRCRRVASALAIARLMDADGQNYIA